MNEKIKSEAVMLVEEKEKLIWNINLLVDKWFVNREIWHLLWESGQYIWQIRLKWFKFSISLKKCKEINKNFQELLPKL